MSLVKLFIGGIIIICISILGGLVVLATLGPLAVSVVTWFEENPIWRGIFSLIGLILIVILFLALSKWLLKKVV